MIGITGIGGISAGGEFSHFQSPLQLDLPVLAEYADLVDLPQSLAGVADKSGFKSHLKRRKAAKLFTPAARMGLSAAAMALGEAEDRQSIGLFVGVGREPPDEGEAEMALVCSERNGQLDPLALSGPGRDVYPPLLPLKTLPNMILAHISIHLDLMGCNGAWAGGPDAGVTALLAAYWAVCEGRCEVALAGASDSLIDLGQARDLLRQGITTAPGEGAVFMRLERISDNRKTPWEMEWTGEQGAVDSLSEEIGYCGATDALLHLAYVLSRGDTFCWRGLRFTKGLP